MTLQTLLLLRQVLGAQQLSAGADDFADVSAQVVHALRELDAAIAEATE